MSYYLDTGGNNGKAKAITDAWDGRIVPEAPSFASLRAAGEVLVAVKHNGPFEAAAICYNEREQEEFCCDSSDKRPTQFVVLSKVNTIEAFDRECPDDKQETQRLVDDLNR